MRQIIVRQISNSRREPSVPDDVVGGTGVGGEDMVLHVGVDERDTLLLCTALVVVVIVVGTVGGCLLLLLVVVFVVLLLLSVVQVVVALDTTDVVRLDRFVPPKFSSDASLLPRLPLL